MHEEIRIFGPPGTGKTTTLSRWIDRAVQSHGSANVIVASFTKAAAAEIVGRGLPIDNSQVGTIHAHGYRSIGCPTLAGEAITDWNAEHPEYQINGEVGNLDDMESEHTFTARGDEVFRQYDKCRALMLDRRFWPSTVQAFASEWEAWKEDADVIDFTDMVERALRDCPVAPGNPAIGFFDEVQDCTPLELALIRRWAAPMEYVVLAGDDDQAIYGFRGASPDAFLDPPVDDEHKRVLAQSYRVPRAVQATAEAWIAQLTRRETKEYKPRDDEGEVRRLGVGTWKAAERLLYDAESYLAAGKTVAFLGSCSYLLRPLISVLRREGVPFHNKWQRKRGDWNPLYSSRGTTSAERLLAFLAMDPAVWGDRARDVWTAEDLRAWVDVVKSDAVLTHGAKRDIAATDDVTIADLRRWFTPEAFAAAGSLDLDWFERSLLAARAKAMHFPLTIARRRGAAVLRKEPKVTVSTIHGCKGGEADVVYLLPDMSRSGMVEWMMQGRDAVTRLFYVGMTRAKESLVLCAPAGPCSVRIAA